MKRNAGVFMLFAMMLAGARLTTHPTQAPSAASHSGPVSAALREIPIDSTSCPAFSSTDPEKELGSDGKATSLVQRFLGTSPTREGTTPGSLPGGIRFMVAMVPDPLHTHLNLQFDRTLEALQQALQDEGYTYDSSWLPWKARSNEYSSLNDRKADEKETARRELCPGLILFRSSMNAPRNKSCLIKGASGISVQGDSYQCGMFVFVITETATAGLNLAQWKNAQSWISTHAPPGRLDKTLRILGPNFSGSMPSMVRALDELSLQRTFDNSLLYAGRIRGCASWHWMNDQLTQSAALPVRTADFDENDAIQIDRFYRYIADRGHALSEAAVLSEDETAYGGLPDPALTSFGDPTKTTQSACEPTYAANNRPVHLYYPRDISAVRSAYQEQSIFSSGNNGEAGAAHTVLQAQYDATTSAGQDAIEPFGRLSLALTQEAQLYGIVNTLRTHAIRYVVLRSTNSLDYLFLTRFLRRAYPDAYMITMGTDMLFGRDVDSTEFRGVVALSTFPLLPRGQDWTVQTSSMDLQPQHAHRVFSSDIMEGVYLAARFVTSDCENGQTATDCWQKNTPAYAHHSKKDIPDYAEPFWEKEGGQLSASTWMSVIGREGYWPIAVLKSSFDKHNIYSNLAAVERPSTEGASQGVNQGVTAQGWFSLSSAWKFFCFMTVVAVCLHFVASRWGWQRQSLAIFIQFTPMHTKRQSALMALGWATICSLVVMLLLASARLFHWLRGVDQVWVWLIGACAIAGCAATLMDGQFGKQARAEAPPAPLRRQSWWWAIGALILIAITFCLGLRMFDYQHPEGVVVAYRSVHLSSGVSPLISLLLMICGFYWWFWQSLEGLSLLGPGKPTLPRKEILPQGLSRVSSEMANSIESSAIPIPNWSGVRKWMYLAPLFLLFLQVCVLQRPWSQGFDAVVHSLESKSFNWTLHGMFALGLYLLILDAMQLWLTWASLKRLLLALNRLPLRRTFAALQGLSMQSLWSMSGTSSRARYTVFSHQIESLIHLRNALGAFSARNFGSAAIRSSIGQTLADGMLFISTRSQGADLAMSNDRDAFNIRISFSECTEQILSGLLMPEWLQETKSIDLRESPAGERSGDHLPLSDNKVIQLAEEFVCLIYVGYLQNMLARMRTIVLSMTGIFAMIALSIAFYPYTPRPLLSIALLTVLLTIGIVVGSVYAGLDRDSTLSRITNTTPGNLGLNFWIRILSFVGVPAMGLIVAQFPEVTDFLSSWVQPTMNAVK